MISKKTSNEIPTLTITHLTLADDSQIMLTLVNDQKSMVHVKTLSLVMMEIYEGILYHAAMGLLIVACWRTLLLGPGAKGNGASRVQTSIGRAVGTRCMWPSAELNQAGAGKGSLLGWAWVGNCGANYILRGTELERPSVARLEWVTVALDQMLWGTELELEGVGTRLTVNLLMNRFLQEDLEWDTLPLVEAWWICFLLH